MRILIFIGWISDHKATVKLNGMVSHDNFLPLPAGKQRESGILTRQFRLPCCTLLPDLPDFHANNQCNNR
jgi:hypothetical protein